MIAGLYITDHSGNLILKKYFNPFVSPLSRSLLTKLASSLSPVTVFADRLVTVSKFSAILIMCVSAPENSMSLASKPAMIFAFVHKLYLLLNTLLAEITENTLLDNIFPVLELIDESFWEFPQSTCFQEISFAFSKEASRVFSRSSFAPGTESNEFFVEHSELVDILLDEDGKVVTASVRGRIEACSYLRGDPTVKLAFRDSFGFPPSLERQRKSYKRAEHKIGAVRFHENVKLDRALGGSFISLKPPVGTFELMTYRFPTSLVPLFAVSASAELKGQSVAFSVSLRSVFSEVAVASVVRVYVPTCSFTKKAVLKTQTGSATFKTESGMVLWELQNFKGQADAVLVGTFLLASTVVSPEINKEELEREIKRPVRLEFNIPSYTVSGFTLENVEVLEKSGYKVTPMVTYATRNGNYEVRIK